MNTEAQVRAAGSLPEAILVLAQALDRIEAVLNQPTIRHWHPLDGWDAWIAEQQAEPGTSTWEHGAPSPAAIVINEDDEPEVKAAKQRLLNDKGQGIELGAAKGQQAHTEGDEVVLPPPTEAQQWERYNFAQAILKLDVALPEVEDALGAYAKGGPMWLYLGNRDLVMAQPPHVKQAMIADVERFSPKDAYDLGRDILKVQGTDGPELTMESLLRD